MLTRKMKNEYYYGDETREDEMGRVHKKSGIKNEYLYKVLVENLGMKRPLGKIGYTWLDGIKMDLE
jgi:Zn-dependent metalloprotease